MLIDDGDDNNQSADDQDIPVVDNPGEAGETPSEVPAPEEKPFNESDATSDVAGTDPNN